MLIASPFFIPYRKCQQYGYDSIFYYVRRNISFTRKKYPDSHWEIYRIVVTVIDVSFLDKLPVSEEID